MRGPWNEGQGPWPEGIEWDYIEKPEEQWLGTAIRQNEGAEQNPTGSPDVAGDKVFTHEQRHPHLLTDETDWPAPRDSTPANRVVSQWIWGSGGLSAARPVKASRTRSRVAATIPVVLSTAGFGGVPGCGRVGAIFLARSSLSPSLFELLTTRRRFESWEDNVLLVGDVLAAEFDEFLQGLVEFRLTRLSIGSRRCSNLLTALFLRDRFVGEGISVVERCADGGPKELFFDRFMLRLGDDKVGHHRAPSR